MARDFIIANSEIIDTNNRSYDGASEMSMFVWIYSDDTPSSLEMIFGARNGSEICRLFYNTSGTFQWQLNAGGSNTTNTDDSAIISTGQWVHLGAVYNGSVQKRWLDSVNTGTNNSNSGNIACDEDMRYGGYHRTGVGDSLFFDGKIAYVCLSTSAMSDNKAIGMGNHVHPFACHDSNTVYINELWGHDDPEPNLIGTDTHELVNSPAAHRQNPPVELIENYC